MKIAARRNYLERLTVVRSFWMTGVVRESCISIYAWLSALSIAVSGCAVVQKIELAPDTTHRCAIDRPTVCGIGIEDDVKYIVSGAGDIPCAFGLTFAKGSPTYPPNYEWNFKSGPWTTAHTFGIRTWPGRAAVPKA